MKIGIERLGKLTLYFVKELLALLFVTVSVIAMIISIYYGRMIANYMVESSKRRFHQNLITQDDDKYIKVIEFKFVIKIIINYFIGCTLYDYIVWINHRSHISFIWFTGNIHRTDYNDQGLYLAANDHDHILGTSILVVSNLLVANDCISHCDNNDCGYIY